jgi:mRNA-degrading endonuclease RelE of RelBE toxin-antitoxin system
MPKHHVEVEWTENARRSLREIGSRTIQQKIALKITDLAESGEPELLGKPLVDQLHGLYRISFGRYRIIYRVIRDQRNSHLLRIIVRVLLTGIRKQGDKIDIYEIAQRLQRQGKL